MLCTSPRILNNCEIYRCAQHHQFTIILPSLISLVFRYTISLKHLFKFLNLLFLPHLKSAYTQAHTLQLFHPLVGSLPRYPQQSDLNQAEARRILEFNPGLYFLIFKLISIQKVKQEIILNVSVLILKIYFNYLATGDLHLNDIGHIVITQLYILFTVLHIYYIQ